MQKPLKTVCLTLWPNIYNYLKNTIFFDRLFCFFHIQQFNFKNQCGAARNGWWRAT